jgi:hypothetical protein
VLNKRDRWTFTVILTVALLLIALAPLPVRFCSPPQPCPADIAFPSTTFPLVFSAGVALFILAGGFYFRKRNG